MTQRLHSVDAEISASMGFTHDFALDGPAVVSGRDDMRGYWYFVVLP